MEQNEVNSAGAEASQVETRGDVPAHEGSEQTARDGTATEARACGESGGGNCESAVHEGDKGEGASAGSGLDALRLENERLTRELSEAREAGLAGLNGGQVDARTEIGILRNVVSRQRFEHDLAEIKSRFPDEKAGDITELGEQFLRLRAAGVDNLTAYAASTAQRANATAAKIPETGAVGAESAAQKEYYSPAEVDRLGKKELGDPNILSRVQKSMTKWRREA